MSQWRRGSLGGIRRRTTGLVMMVVFANLVACTVYTPVHGDIDAAGQPKVRVTLTDEGRVAVAPRLGLRANQLTGTLHSMSDSSLSLTVREVSREGGIEDNYDGLDLSLTRRDIEAVEKSETSVSRSVLLTVAIAIASAFLVKGLGDISGGSDSGPPSHTK